MLKVSFSNNEFKFLLDKDKFASNPYIANKLNSNQNITLTLEVELMPGYVEKQDV